MKTSSLLLMGAAALAAYLYLTKSSTASTGQDYLQTAYYTDKYGNSQQATIAPIPSEYSGEQRASQTVEHNQQLALDNAARAGETVYFYSGSGSTAKVVGVQDAKLQMSYRIEADKKLLEKASPAVKQTTEQARVQIAGTPYSIKATSPYASIAKKSTVLKK